MSEQCKRCGQDPAKICVACINAIAGDLAITQLVKALKEADSFIRDLVVLLKPPAGTVEYFHGETVRTRQESIDYTVDGALRFLDGIDINSYPDTPAEPS